MENGGKGCCQGKLMEFVNQQVHAVAIIVIITNGIGNCLVETLTLFVNKLLLVV